MHTANRADYFPALDGLRAISVLLVVGYHSAVPGDLIFRHGDYGVQIFFAISGFLITTLLLRERERSGGIDLRRFYIRRTGRIFPLYYAVLLLYTVLVWRFEPIGSARTEFWRDLPAFLTYTSNWFVSADGSRIIFYLAWSLAVEEQFYLVWPTLVKRVRAPLALALIAGVAAFAHWFFRCIGLGCILAIALDRGYLERVFGDSRTAVLSFAALMAVLLVPALGSARGWFGAVVAVCLVASVVVPNDGLVQRLLSSRVLRHVGTVSYGMYLLNLLCVRVAHRLVGAGYGSLLVAVLMAVLVATISSRLFEQPIRRFAQRVADRSVSIRSLGETSEPAAA